MKKKASRESLKPPKELLKPSSLVWEPDEIALKGSRVALFDGLLILRCYETGNGDWASLALGADPDAIGFGELFASEEEAKQAAETWLFEKINELK
jgi:hypothetical protein